MDSKAEWWIVLVFILIVALGIFLGLYFGRVTAEQFFGIGINEMICSSCHYILTSNTALPTPKLPENSPLPSKALPTPMPPANDRDLEAGITPNRVKGLFKSGIYGGYLEPDKYMSVYELHSTTILFSCAATQHIIMFFLSHSNYGHY